MYNRNFVAALRLLAVRMEKDNDSIAAVAVDLLTKSADEMEFMLLEANSTAVAMGEQPVINWGKP